ncbi:hypothetical protein GQ53DRAFT_750955 [Thozetella sp. PMI_491]|nr:hypothetical protein GQ53DRAFT_750955 [Thozetella sp. PMI_491]
MGERTGSRVPQWLWSCVVDSVTGCISRVVDAFSTPTFLSSPASAARETGTTPAALARQRFASLSLCQRKTKKHQEYNEAKKDIQHRVFAGRHRPNY